jgi:beta-alanine--pyruvate transaminase
MDYAPPFQFGHPKGVRARHEARHPRARGSDQVFFTNSGSEAVDTALKIALAYHRAAAGRAQRLIGRERGYHGVTSAASRWAAWSPTARCSARCLPASIICRHTYNRAEQAFTRGEPEWGAHLADELERLVGLHDASTIAAVIVEPMAGSTGVLPRPRAICRSCARSATSTASC